MPTLAPYPFLECVHPHSHCTPSSNMPVPAWYPSSNVYTRTHSVPLPRICLCPHRTPSSNMPVPAPYPFLKCSHPYPHCTPSLNTPAPALHSFLEYACTHIAPLPRICLHPHRPSLNVYACARTVPPSSNTPVPAPYPFLKYACTRIAPAPHQIRP
ncbi:hypothetical protein K438DRAFT_1592657 [Mycena galopus ATCC 62051]|nr:hypothetical protein K438DRAFT_1592657 [Mycena galopus ATCC 62051]